MMSNAKRKEAGYRGFFVTGTDTGVGKTMVACALAVWYRMRGVDVGVMKPVGTGGRRMRAGTGYRWLSDDARLLRDAAGVRDPWALINPICFKEPLAPWSAGLRERRNVSLQTAMRAMRSLRKLHEVIIIEGIGGLLVPFSAQVTLADLARLSSLPLIIVARAGLGTLNHSLLTVSCAERMGLRVAAIVLNEPTKPSLGKIARATVETNLKVLRRLIRYPVLGPLPFLKDAGCLSRKTPGASCKRRQASLSALAEGIGSTLLIQGICEKNATDYIRRGRG